MKLNNILRLSSSNTIDALKKSLRLSIAEAPNYLNMVKAANKEAVYQKFVSLNQWYTKLLGLDEVKAYQDRVTNLQEQLLDTQDKRREIGRQLAEVRLKSNELQDQIHKVKRQDDLNRFLDLMKEETEVLKIEQSITRTFQEFDQAERELFTAFTNAIRDSHEKQRAQLEYTKYFGLILSITGSFLAFCYSTLKKRDLKNFIEQKIASIDYSSQPVLSFLVKNNNSLDEVVRNQQRLNEVIRILQVEQGNLKNLENVLDNNRVFVSQEIKYEHVYALVGGCFVALVLLRCIF